MKTKCESDRLSITFNILLILSGRKDQRRKIFAFVCVSTSAKCNSTLQMYTASTSAPLNASSHVCEEPSSSGQTSTTLSVVSIFLKDQFTRAKTDAKEGENFIL